jgi:hypothetical protein
MLSPVSFQALTRFEEFGVGGEKPITIAHPHFLIYARMSVENELYNALVCAANSLVKRASPRLRDPSTPGPNAVKRREAVKQPGKTTDSAVVRQLWQRAPY